MNRSPSEHNIRFLWALVITAGLFGSLLHFLPRLTGIKELDGLSGVLAGLYICAQPAANMLNLLLYGPELRWRRLVQRSNFGWAALNLIVLFSGLGLIVIGTTRYFSHSL